jgi:hypothetical protein
MMTLADFADGPVLIIYITGQSVRKLAFQELEQMAAAGRISPEWNQKFSIRLAGLNPIAGEARAVDGERIVFGQFLFEQILGKKIGLDDFLSAGSPYFGPDGWKEWLLFQEHRIPGVVRLEYADFLDLMRELRVALASPAKDYAALERRWNNLGSPRPNQLLLRITYPVVSMTMSWRLHAKISIARIGLALERYHAAKGGYPAALSDLAPDYINEVPPDIYTGKPLLYRSDQGGAVIYSVGQNMKDDGGIEDLETDKDDISWASGTAAVRKFTPPPPKPAAAADEPDAAK